MSGDISSDEFKLKKEELEEQKKKLQGKIAELQEVKSKSIYEEVEKGFNLSKEFEDALENGDNSNKHYFVKTLGVNHKVKDKVVSLELKSIYREVRLLVNSIKSEYNLIEPKKAIATQGSFSDLDRISPLMGQFMDRIRNLYRNRQF